jgi:ATP-binding cassette subfamily B protein
MNNSENAEKYTTGTLIKRFLPYFKPYRKTLYTDLFCAALTTICEIVLPLIIRKITNTALIDVTLLTARMIVGLALVYFVLRIIDALANYYMADIGHVMGAKIETDMRREAYSHLQQLSNTYFNNTKVGQIMGRITNDLFEVTEFAHHCPEEFFIAALKIVISFIILSGINFELTLMVFIFVPIMTVVCRLINKKMRRAFSEQRISIARVFLKNPPIIILDEATSALDNESEYAVAKSLNELAKGRTTLTIAHRLSSIKNSDRILVLTDDGIVEEGNHDELMAQNGIYYQFYTMANEVK